MVSAVVLLNTDLGAQEEVVDNLRHINGVEEAHALYGVYDLLVRVKAKDLEDLRNMTKSQIKQVAGVTSSLTLVLHDGLKEISTIP
jgi:DNA-binding Lrp family transcriptional regulator